MPFITQPSFSAGELAPSLHSRIDLAKYGVGAKTMENFFCHPHGGASNRPGTKYVDALESPADNHRLIPFIVSSTQAYVFDLFDGFIRIFKYDGTNHGPVTLDLCASPLHWESSASGTNEYYLVQGSGSNPNLNELFNLWENGVELDLQIMGPGHLAAGEFAFGKNAADSILFNTVYVRLTDNSNPESKADGYIYNIVEIPTNYDDADIFDIDYAQSIDVMWLAHQDYPLVKISRNSETDWDFQEGYEFLTDGPWVSRNSNNVDTKITLSALSGIVTVTADGAIFASKHEGSFLRIGFSDPVDETSVTWGYIVIGTVSSSTSVIGTVVNDLGFEMIFNPEFEFGMSGYVNASQGDGEAIYDATSGEIECTDGTALDDYGGIYQIVDVNVGEEYTLTVVVTRNDGKFKTRVGEVEYGEEFLVETNQTGTGTFTYTFVPTSSTVYVQVDTTGSSTGQETHFSGIKMRRTTLTTPDWRLSAFNDTDGWPRAVSIYQQRLTLGGTAAWPLGLWFSKTGDFDDFQFNNPSEDSDGFFVSLDSGRVDSIQWIVPLGTLVVGTSGSEWSIAASTASEGFSAATIDARAQSYYGSAKIKPLLVGSNIIFAQFGKDVLQNLAYSIDVDGFAGTEISLMAKHMFDGYNVVDWGYARRPDSICWTVRDDGTLLGLTYMKEQEVIGWHRHTFENGTVKSVCTIPYTDQDFVYLVVEREIDGNTVKYLEVLQPRITDEATYNYFFVDSGLTYSGVAADTITGLDHLEGEDVVALAEGNVIDGLTVSGGSITLPAEYTLVHIGLPITADLEPIGAELNDNLGSTKGRTRSIPSVVLNFYKSRVCWIGPDATKLFEFPFRNDALGEDPLDLLTNVRRFTLKSGYEQNGAMLIRNTDPVPLTILAITPDIEFSER